MAETSTTVFNGENPLVSVAMPIYNAGKYLRPAVLSIVNQTFTNWEMFIIDDGSTDDALTYIADVQDARIKIIKDGLNKGLAARLNQGIELAKGRYFARMDQDDISYPERFAKQFIALENDDKLDLVSVRAIKISMQDEPIGYLPFAITHDEIIAAPWRGFYMPHPTWMGRIEWFRLHRYAQPGPYLCEDQELLLRTFVVSNFGCLSDVCFAYRIRDKIILQKLIKIRIKLLQLQLASFTSRSLFLFAIFSVLFFLAKITKDYLNDFFGLKYAPHKKTIISADEIFKLTRLLATFKARKQF